MNNRINRRAITLAGALAVSLAAGLRGQSTPPAGSADDSARIVEGLGKPSDQARVSFEGNAEGSSIIEHVTVQPGDLVKKGDELMREDTSLAVAKEKVLKAASEATGAAKEADVTIDAQNKLIQKYQDLSPGNSAGVELLNAVRDRDVAVARKQQATEEQTQRILGDQEQLEKIAHMTLRSPIDGVVQSVNLHAGEVVDASSDKDGACFVIKNDPMWVEIQHIGAAQAGRLALHDKVDVAFEDAPDQWHTGEIIFLDPAVDPATQTRVIRVSVPNPDNKPSGLRMLVRLPEKAALTSADPVGFSR
jgi:multidrug efflux pump subunit AcrA (membrane-fusion protein)